MIDPGIIIIELVVGLIIGLAVGFFLKVSLKILLLFLGFYAIVTIGLILLGIISININLEMIHQVLTSISTHDSALVQNLMDHIGFLIGFVVGFVLGFFKIRLV